MMIGTIREIWRYPVKSLGGEQLDATDIHKLGMAGDRSWALVDINTGEICSAKRYPQLLNLQAAYKSPPGAGLVYGEDVNGVQVSFPHRPATDDVRDASAGISEYLGGRFELRPLQPPENLDHYRLKTELSEADFGRVFNIQPGEAGPDFSDYEDSMIALLSEYACPPGTYYDVFPLHLLTTASLKYMTEKSGTEFDVRRFRPNLLVETGSELEGIAEFDWVGKTLRVGGTTLQVESRTIRCSMPSREQVQYGIEQNSAVSKAIYQATNRYLGVNMTVVEAGGVSVGDEVEIF